MYAIPRPSVSHPQPLNLSMLCPLFLHHSNTPQFYSTSTLWSQTLNAPLYISSADRPWFFGPVPSPTISSSTDAPLPPSPPSFSAALGPHLLTKTHTEIVPNVTAVICGGHFDGSMCLHWEKKLFVADTLMTIPVCCVVSCHVTLRYRRVVSPCPLPLPLLSPWIRLNCVAQLL